MTHPLDEPPREAPYISPERVEAVAAAILYETVGGVIADAAHYAWHHAGHACTPPDGLYTTVLDSLDPHRSRWTHEILAMMRDSGVFATCPPPVSPEDVAETGRCVCLVSLADDIYMAVADVVEVYP